MKLYIDGPEDGGEGHYVLVAETGEVLAGHWCSHRGYARFDLIERRVDLQKELAERFGEYQVLWIGEDELTRDELVQRNRALVGEEIGSEVA